MKRRAFSTAAAMGSALLGAGRLAHAQGPVPQNGKDYLTLSQRAPVDTPPGKVELIEFFWYSCPHCNAFEPQFDSWAKSAAAKDVAVRRMPIAFRDDFVPQQKLYFALEAMGKLDDVHRKVFYAIHAEKNNLATDAAVLGWIEKIGLDKKAFVDAYGSFGVASKAKRAVQLQDAYKITGVPSLGVAGRFYIDGGTAGSMGRALQVAEFLIDQVRKGK